MIYDQLIIGCGVAGLIELKKALQEKKNVCVVAKGFGAMQHLTGAFDSSVSQDFFDFYGVPGVSEEGLQIVGSVGLVRSVGSAFKTQCLTKAEAKKTKKVLFVEVFGLPDFPASLVVPNLKKSFSNVVLAKFSAFDLNITSPQAHLLQLFEKGDGVEAFEEFLRKNKGDAEVIVCPPILGIKNFVAIHGRLEKNVGVRIVEQLSTTPPVAGLRFVEIIKDYFLRNKINVVWGEVVGFEKEGNRVLGIVVGVPSSARGSRNTDDGIRTTVQAKEFTLTTGKFVGGGLRFEDGVQETVFDLPCSTNEGVVSKKTPITNLITRNPKQEQAFSGLGVLTDPQGCVVDPLSRLPIFENLKAVGGVRVS